MSDPVNPSSAIEAELAALSLVFSREPGAGQASGRWTAELDPALDSTLADLRVRAQALGADQADERLRLGDRLEGVSDLCEAWRAMAAQARQVRGSRVQSAVGERAAALSGALVARWDAMLLEAAVGGEDKLPLIATIEVRREQLLSMETEAEVVDRAVEDALEETRVAFPRLYFLSNEDVLEIIAADGAQDVLPHLGKVFEVLADLRLEADGSAGTGMASGDGTAVVEFETPLALEGRRPEEWLPQLEIRMRESLKLEQQITMEAHADTPYQEWVTQGCGEMVLLVSAIEHTVAVDEGLDQQPGTLKAYKHEVATQIETLCRLASKNLTRKQRYVMGALATLVVHWRDEATRLLDCGAQQRESFERQVQLKYRLDSETKAATIHMLDFSQNYGCALMF